MVIFSLINFTAYLLLMILMFGIPTSLSDTFYLLQAHKKWASVAFVLLMYSIAITLVAPIIDATPDGLQIFAFIPIVGIGFVGAAPLFKGQDSLVHKVAALAAAIGSIFWVLLTHIDYWPYLVFSAILFGTIMLLSKTIKCYIFWAEMVVFYSMYAILISLA